MNMKHLLKKILFFIERVVGICFGLSVRPSRSIALWLFTRMVSTSKVSGRMSVLLSPFFLEFGRVGLDRNGPMVVKHILLTGARIRLNLAEKNERNLYVPTVYEEGLTRFVIASLKPGDIFIDVGANVGYFSLIAASLDARVTAIEPDDENLALFEQNIRLNGYSSIMVLNAAVGDREGTAILHVNPLNRGGNSLLGYSEYFSGTHGYTRQQITEMYRTATLEKKVALTTLDAVIKKQGLTSIRIVKIDVEGFEKQALDGTKATLSSGIVEYLICELGNKETRAYLLDTLRSYGYQAYSADQKGELTKTLGRDVIFKK